MASSTTIGKPPRRPPKRRSSKSSTSCVYGLGLTALVAAFVAGIAYVWERRRAAAAAAAKAEALRPLGVCNAESDGSGQPFSL